MKELTTEQKAAIYDEAIKKAKIEKEKSKNLELLEFIDEIFPELSESNDERIKKEIISIINAWDTSCRLEGEYCEVAPECIAWLEKQGEQKPVDMAEPKFKVGDWIVYKDTVWKICNISLLNYYELLKINNEVSTRTIEDVDESAHLWTVQDVRNGDVLVDEDNNIGLYKEEKDDIYWESYIYLGCNGELLGYNIGGYHRNKNTKPATKEQRDALFTKMKESGFIWDASIQCILREYSYG